MTPTPCHTEEPAQGSVVSIARAGLVSIATGVLLLTCMLSTGCTRRVTAAEVNADSQSYYGQVVVLEGSASAGYSIGGYGIYELRDATGSVRVVSKSGVPDSGAVLRVKGRVNAPIELGVVTIGTHIAEDSREAP